MCDCLPEKDTDGGDRAGPETVTLFKKCQRSDRSTKDIAGRSNCDTISDKDDWEPVDSSLSVLGAAICCGTKASKTCSGTSSDTRTYKFVSPRECECLLGEDEEEPWEPPILSFEPCVYEEEVEERPDIECTLAIIKPEAVVYRREIERRIFEEGFEIYQTRWLQLTPEQVSEFYSDKYGQLNFAHLVAYMASGPLVVHVLAKRHGIDEWRSLMGPTKVTEARLYYPDSIRARFGRRGEDFKNAVHGSCSRDDAEREIHFFFPEFIVEPLLKDESAIDYLEEVVNPVLVEGLSMCCKVKPADPVLWLANWLILNNPNKPKLPQDLAMIPT
ncbi:Nucleoside diphosphate kinase like protein 5 [Dufourea novaeangliae]|uniref:Nucleoside diphosphate kinase like protein 5 n=1 Tax=Dufourea novaeangliae TaxID=178035 RepID=A0A154P751_DUFNO|nr:Nucleoside diphosphate kinase like protein 5 [Dufourea novaeangliae]